MSRHQYEQGGLRVPYIAAWSTEQYRTPAVVLRGGQGGAGIGFADETPYDRDADGVLWVRQVIAPGTGRPLFPNAHALRQRRAVKRMLCQVCGVDTLEQNPERQLFVLKDIGQPVREGERTSAAPVCPPCALIAVKECPHLREHVAAWVRRPVSWGVAGVLYDPRTLRPIPDEDLVQVSYDDDAAIRWVLASRQLLSLQDCTAVDLRDLSPQLAVR